MRYQLEYFSLDNDPHCDATRILREALDQLNSLAPQNTPLQFWYQFIQNLHR